MKKPAFIFITGFLLGIAAFVANAATVDPPHYDPASGYTCVRCHTSHMDLGATGQKLFNNTCLNCHRLSDPKAGTKPFTPADAADPFNIHSSVQPKQRFQHSHRWDGSDTNPAAGALPPVYPTMTTHNLRGRTGGELACVRCHNQHDNSTSKPFLRMANSQDQMCLDCHRPRDVQDKNKGSHPVRVNYLVSAAKSNSNLKNPIENNNPANSTSDLNFRIALSGGQVLCTTCHGVHYTDSRSSTVDGAANFLSLSSSNGFILRTDMRGPAVARGTTDNLNICTNCHSGKKSHNYKQPVGQDVQCADCHAAHVDIGDGSQPNSFLVRRYMNISTPYGAVRKQPVLTMATSALSTVFVNGSGRGTGVCQACHIVPTGGNYPAQHNTTFAMARDCATCHKHDGQFGSFSGGCTACHGFPPTTATTGGPSGNAAGYTGNESLSKHARHAGGGSNYSYTCDQCHRGNNHMDGNYQDVFRSPAGTLAATGMTPSYNTAASSCANVYCHSNGNGIPATTPPAWFGPAFPSDCTGCHGGNAASSSPNATGKHTAHVNNSAVIGINYGCIDCHAKTVSDDRTIANKANHVNGYKDFSGARAGGSGTYSTTTGVCSATYCHTDGKGTQKDMTVTNWKSAATFDCHGCHGSDPAPAFTSQAGEPNYANGGAGTLRANSHQKHAAAGATSCVNCHSATTTTGTAIISSHTNRVIDVMQGNGKSFAFSAATKSCASISCHFGGSAQWGGSLGCTGCHGNNAASGNPIATNAHSAHINNAAAVGRLIGCAECHAATVSNDATISTPANHANGSVNIKFDNNINLDSYGPTYNGSSTTGANGAIKPDNTPVGSCANIYCHSDGNPLAGSRQYRTIAWNATGISCNGCHGTSNAASNAFPDHVNSGAGIAGSNSHVKHADATSGYSFSCIKCHSSTVADATNTVLLPAGAHLNGSGTVAFDASIPSNAGATYTSATQTCNTSYCHSNGNGTNVNNPQWGATANADCTFCHGNNAASANPISTNKHSAHINNVAVLGTNQNFSCVECHAATVSADRTIASKTRHVNGFKDFTGARAYKTGYSGGSCTTYCHSSGQATPVYRNMTGSKIWMGTATLDCKGCHGYAKPFGGFSSVAGEPNYVSGGAGSATANNHQKHVAGRNITNTRGCVDCHRLTVDQGVVNKLKNYSSLHLNNKRDVNFAVYGGYTGHYTAGTKTCGNTYCHANGTPQWGGTPLLCNSCHNASNTLPGAHKLHWETATVATSYVAPPGNATGDTTKYQFQCSSCHSSPAIHAAGPVSAIQAAQVYFGYSTPGRTGSYTAAGTSAGADGTLSYTAGTNCTTTYCHSDGTGTNGNRIVNWGTNANSVTNTRCSTCHLYTQASGSPMVSGKHTKHISTYTYGCDQCHYATTHDSTTIFDTTKHLNKVKDVAWGTLNAGGGAYVNSATACSNIYCHSNGTAFTAPFGAPNVAVTWSAGPATNCGSCHDGLATGPSYASGSPKANSHNKHVVVMGYTCEKCHYSTTTTGNTITTPANHVNQAYNLQQSGGSVTFTAVANTPPTASTCTNISCHNNNASAIAWGAPSPGCRACHVTSGADVDNFTGYSGTLALISDTQWKATGHGSAFAYTSGRPGANFIANATNECLYCHDSAAPHSSTANNFFRLANYSTIAYGRNAPCLSCHGKNAAGFLGKSVAFTRISSTHYGAKHASGGGGYFCWDCHDPHGDANVYMIHDQVAKTSDRTTGKPLTFAPVSFTGFSTGGNYAGAGTKLCNACHTSASLSHYTASNVNDGHNLDTRCTTCHSHNGPTAQTAFQPSNNCDSCHGYPPIRRDLVKGVDFRKQGQYTSGRFQDYTGGGGAHVIAKHLAPTIKASDGWTPCAICHSNGVMNPATHTMVTPVRPNSAITIDVKDSRKFDYRRSLGQERYTGARLTGDKATNRTGSCSNVSCHFKPSKRWSNSR
ncbi:CxxxxCH/CxxCH domain c-type cytochrome [Geobacter argillaceus]|uniref:CxxxxCH/CxxCH domain c-type cytochrome n=1 Tax=Geobacter argillaceus TaxID=345631 RepID=UPI0014796E55|nr:CxxxxCH/CxxCH domain-containing protein [Geobacter argillaceus]